MAESSESQKKPVNPSNDTPLQEKKPFVAVSKNPFVHKNPSFNSSGCKGRAGGGRPAVRKHAARSR